MLQNAQATISGAGSFTPAGNVLASGVASIQGAGSCTPSGRATHRSHASMSGVAACTPAAKASYRAHASAQGVASCTPLGQATHHAHAFMPGAAACIATGGKIVLYADASLAGHSTCTAAIHLAHIARSTITGLGVVTCLAHARHSAHVSIDAAGHLAATPEGIHRTGEVDMIGGSGFFVNPTKVSVLPILTTAAPPTAKPPTTTQLPRAKPGNPTPKLAVGAPVHTRGTNNGGVPNKG